MKLCHMRRGSYAQGIKAQNVSLGPGQPGPVLDLATGSSACGRRVRAS